MINRWREIGELPCVKYRGLSHKIAHFVGISSTALCITHYLDEGLRRGFIKKEYTRDKEVK